MNSKISSKSRTTKNVTSIVKKEFAIFEVKSKREANLESCQENFNPIPIPERVLFQNVEELLPKLDHLYMMRDMLIFFKIHTEVSVPKKWSGSASYSSN
jgi:hypothetical protein